jgi:hypothetical protein
MSNSKVRNRFNDEEIIKAAKENDSATKAAASLGISYDTFRKHAQRLDVFITNSSRKGLKRTKEEYFKRTIPLNEILEGKHPSYGRSGLKRKLFEAGLKSNKCEVCGIEEWNGVSLQMQLDHIDGNTYNHRLDNLRMICPNCHSQTVNFCGRNKK